MKIRAKNAGVHVHSRNVILWITTIFVLVWGGFQFWPVTIQIHGSIPEESFSIRMPLRDKKRLDFLFREVCFMNVWAYTLMGSKPESVDQYKKPWAAFRDQIKHPDFWDIVHLCFWPPHFKRIQYFLNPHEIRMKLGWETLNKYFRYFPDSIFALNTYVRDDDIVGFSVTNKVQFIKTVKQHLEDFQGILQQQAIEPEDLADNAKLRAFMKCLTHNGLSGTVLGYGRDNAWLYRKYYDSPEEWPMISAWPEEEIVNLDQLNERTMAFQSWQLEDLFYPRFACDPNSEETKELKRIYREEREKIIQYFQGKDLVEAALNLFNQKLSL